MNLKELQVEILNGKKGVNPKNLYITGATSIYQTTQFPGTDAKYKNHYTLLRVESYFGACCHTKEQVRATVATELSGMKLDYGIKDSQQPIQIAAMDAYLGKVYPHKECSKKSVVVPAGTPAVPEREVIYGEDLPLPHLSQQDPKQAASRYFRLQQIRV